SKYQSVMDVANAQGVRISSVSAKDGMLFVQGTAPSLEAANKVWDEIKQVNPRMDDIIAGFTVIPTTSSNSESGALSRAKPTAPGFSTESGTHTDVVKPGDTLSSISKRFYGNARDYMRIFNENTSQLKNPNLIAVGQKLEMPMK